MENRLAMPLTVLRGVSEARKKLFSKLGINTLYELLYHFPAHHEDRSHILLTEDIVSGEYASLLLEVTTQITSVRIRSGKSGRAMTVQKFIASDETGGVRMTFFNSEYLKTVFTVGRKFRFYGIITGLAGSCSMTSPEYEPYYPDVKLPPFVPKYPLTAGLTSKLVSSCVSQALELCFNEIDDYLSDAQREKYSLIRECDALKYIHFPSNSQELEAAKRRLAFDELYRLQLKTVLLGLKGKSGCSRRIKYPDMKAFVSSLPFELTHAQKAAIQDILVDISGVKNPSQEAEYKGENIISPARRLIEGDVGSGKTAVACAAIYACAKSGFQSALMVPTGILALQHYESLKETLGKFGISVALLTGDTAASERKELLKSLENGDTDVLIGTHALIEDKVKFKNLSLVITDEQHRFGVEQRKALEKKSADTNNGALKPHTIVMSATPIPRTLAMIIYCDLDISIIGEMPKGRLKVETCALGEYKRKRAYEFLYDRVREGRQAYVVCALAEEKNKDGEYIQSTGYEMRSAKNLCEELKNGYLSGLRTEYIHGRMKQAEKDAVMQKFARGETDVLVSTTVIEVGVNVPNAAVMLIENAERFGLSQLHQLRGRVGRGKYQSYCILMSALYGKNKDSDFSKRMDIMCKTNDGFEIASKDLELRGPGEFFGQRQHGELCLKMADAVKDTALAAYAKELALEKAESDEGLEIGQIGI